MKKIVLSMLALIASLGFVYAEANSTGAFNNNSALELSSASDGVNYRRSSLCLILVTHQGTSYATEMEREFLKMRLPERYNDHSIDIRVIHTDKALKQKDIEKIVKEQQIGKLVVAKWFNRDAQTGLMNMDLIHERGGFNATVADAERADLYERGRRSLLPEEGVNLIENTFVLVCDMEYKKRNDVGVWSSLATGLLAGGLSALGSAYGQTAQMQQSVRQMQQLSTELADLSGFTVHMDAHLLQLQWNKNDLNYIYDNYWIDEATPYSEAQSKKVAFNNDINKFKLEYLGHYKSRSTTIEMQSSTTFDEAINLTSERTIDKSIKELAHRYPQFRPMTPLVCKDGQLCAYIGTKEDVTKKSKYDVLEETKKNGVIKYNKVATLAVEPTHIWDNKNIRMDEYQLKSTDGTYLKKKYGKSDLCSSSYMLKEQVFQSSIGKHRWSMVLGFNLGVGNIPGVRKTSYFYTTSYGGKKTYHSSSYTTGDEMAFLGNFNISALWNFSKNVSWDLIGMRMGYRNGLDLYYYTGLLFHTNGLGKTNTCLFIWPSVGYNINTGVSDFTSYNYNVKAGVNFKRKFYLAFEYGRFQQLGLSFGWELF